MFEPTLKDSLCDGLRLLAWRRFSRERPSVHAGATLLFAITAVALWIGLDGWTQEEPAQFSVAGLPGIAWYVLTALVVAWIAAALCRPRIPLEVTAWTAALVATPTVLGTWTARFWDPPGSMWVIALTALAATVWAARALRVLTAASQRRALGGALAAAVLLWLLNDVLLIDASLWYPPDSPAASAEVPAADDEHTLYEQPARIDAAVAAVAAHAGPAPQAFMLGFAGVGEQRVFAEEIQLAAKVLGERYGSATRTLLLINDQRDQDSHPIASLSGLQRALHGMAGRMNRDQDVLFLVLSSHGSDDASIAVSNGSMPLNTLDSDSLADALQESGIRWKVIIISACYAGGFIPALRDEYSIVLTAAAADRTSFGCGSDRDFTYFGEALFRDALPGASSLQSAFEHAAAALATRERAEHETPSLPQAYIGAKMAAHLADLEQSPAAAAARRPPAIK